MVVPPGYGLFLRALKGGRLRQPPENPGNSPHFPSVTSKNVAELFTGFNETAEDLYYSVLIYLFSNSDECHRMSSNRNDELPDVRDGLARKERIILYCLDQLQKEREGRNVPTAMLYGRVIEYIDMSPDEFQGALTKFGDRVSFSD